jgi:hypothetical protein
MRVFEVRFQVIEEAETAEQAVDQVLAHYDIRDYLDVTDVTEELGEAHGLV